MKVKTYCPLLEELVEGIGLVGVSTIPDVLSFFVASGVGGVDSCILSLCLL